MAAAKPALILLVACLFPLLPGCGAAGRQRAVSSFIDGWPTLPERADYCREYLQKKENDAQGAKGAPPSLKQVAKSEGSHHRPFVEKRCSDCHDTSQGISSSLIKPKEQLCFVCHQNLLKGRYGHGPATDGECLACHEPHDSVNGALLVKPRKEICDKCHEEKRVAGTMHAKIADAGLACPDCHAPHSSPFKYLLK